MSESELDGAEAAAGDSLTILLVEDNPGDARYIEEIVQNASELTERTSVPAVGVPGTVEPPEPGDTDGVGDQAEPASETDGKTTGESTSETDGKTTGESTSEPGGEPATERPDDVPEPAAEGTSFETRAPPTIIHESRLEDALAVVEETAIDVVLLDLNLPDSEGLDTLERTRSRSKTVPIVVLTGLRDRDVGMSALESGADEYLVKVEVTSDLLIRSVYHAIERKTHERQLERQRNQLATLNALNGLVNEISHLAIESSTREEIEEMAVERLAAADPYRFAWIGEVDRDHETITMRTEAGVEGYLESVTVRIDDSEAGQGPTGRAVRSGEVEVARDIPNNPDYEPWREQAIEHGFESSAAIPIAYEGSLYGVLNVYSPRPDAFEADELAVVGRLGDVIGHAINAIDRKQALMSEDVVEVRFSLGNVLDAVGISGGTGGTITFDRAIPVGEETFLEYGTVTEDGVETLETLVEHLPHFESVKYIEEGEDRRRFELRLSEPPVVSTVAGFGGRVDSATIEDGDYQMVVHVPPSAEVSRVVDVVQAEYPEASVIAQRHTTRANRSAVQLESFLMEELTEKQRSALESAYYAGFFDWPRQSSGEEVAESMDVSPSTFHQHVRVAEGKLVKALFDVDEPGS